MSQTSKTIDTYMLDGNDRSSLLIDCLVDGAKATRSYTKLTCESEKPSEVN